MGIAVNKGCKLPKGSRVHRKGTGALFGMFWGKIKQTDKEKSEAIKELH